MKPKYKNLIKKASALTVVISLATAGMLSGIYLISAHAEESEQYESTSTVASGEDMSIDEAHFPDECFRGWLKYEDKNNDGILSWEERQNVTSLQVNQSAIVSLKGIEYFPNLELLNCANNQINEMDLSGNPLLVALLCYNNMLTELDVSKNPKLEMLSCMGNDVKELDVSHNPSLTFLSCMYTNISELNLENNPALESLFCTGNQISELNLEANTSLVEVDVSGNHLDSLHLNTVNLKKFRGEEEKISIPFSKNAGGKITVRLKNAYPNIDLSKVSMGKLSNGGRWDRTSGKLTFDTFPEDGFSYTYQIDGTSSLLEVHAILEGETTIPADGLTIDQTEEVIRTGGTVQLAAAISPSDASDQEVVWSSSDESIASVNSEGLVTGVAAGTAIITAAVKDNSLTAECRVAVHTPVSMYRLYNPNSGEHFYSGSEEERDNLVSNGWNYEGIGWYAPTDSGQSVYRLYNPNAGDHHYTMSAEERDNLVNAGWTFEGISWNSAEESQLPLYRLYNPNAVAGAHHYTLSSEEKNSLVNAGWKYEGISWYGLK